MRYSRSLILRYRKIFFPSFLSCLLFMVSCAGRDGGVMSDSDSILIDSLADTVVVPEKVHIRFEDSSEALTYLDTVKDSEKYAGGLLRVMAVEQPSYVAKIIDSEAEGFLIVDKATMKLYRYDKYGHLQEKVGIACSKYYGAKHKKRDNRTPEGIFSIQGKYDSTDWLYTDDDGNTSPTKGQFGPRFLRIYPQIGIHGTCAPWSIGGRRSHGCIRMTNENILRIFDIVEKGWPVIVSPGPRDMAVNQEEGYDIPSITVELGRPRAVASRYIPDQKKENPAPADTAKLESLPDTI